MCYALHLFVLMMPLYDDAPSLLNIIFHGLEFMFIVILIRLSNLASIYFLNEYKNHQRFHFDSKM